MAITTIDGALAGMQPPRFFHKAVSPTAVLGRPQSTWGLAGVPGAGSFDTTLNGVVLDCTSALINGQLPFFNPGSGTSYLARFVGSFSNGGQLLLCDRLWHNGGYTITSTSAQNSTTPTWPARDNTGSTNGDGVLLGLEVSSVTGAGAPTISVSYTNSSGTSGKTATNAFATVGASAAGAFFPIGLQAGDTGVRSVQSLTLSATWTSGTMNLVAYRVIAAMECNNSMGNALDILEGGFPQMFNGTVPWLTVIPAIANTFNLSGSLAVAQG